MKSFIDCITQIGQKVGSSKAFGDFLTFVVCCLSMQEQEEEYLQTAKSYSKEEMVLFSDAFAFLIAEMDNNGEGLKDCLGDYFMEYSKSKDAGQFFTPPGICDLMAELNPIRPFSSIADPCCGSGRLFLSLAKQRKYNLYFGSDISYQCCQMTLINLCLNGLYGTISHMDTLSLEKWHQWDIKPHPQYKTPYIHKIDLNAKKDIQREIILHDPKEEIPILTTIQSTQFTEFLSQIDSIL